MGPGAAIHTLLRTRLPDFRRDDSEHGAAITKGRTFTELLSKPAVFISYCAVGKL